MEDSVFQQSVSDEIYNQNYRYNVEDDSWSDTAKRVVTALLAPDEGHRHYDELFEKAYDAIVNRRVLPGGRVIANAGTDYDSASLLNCFVTGFESPNADSIEGIMGELSRCAKILASEGGYGFNVDTLRPRNSIIQGTGARTPGAVEMLNLWDQTSATLTKGPERESNRDDAKEKVRKGAMMVTMSMWHPDVEEFITAKQEAGRLSKFNMSVLVSDKFMNAVKNGQEWRFYFPDYEAQPEKYDREWDGNIDKWIESGGEIVDCGSIPARSLWDKVMKSSYDRNEPGVLFKDTINNRNPLYYSEHIKATNPCGEIPMPEGSVCNLINLVLPRYYSNGTLDTAQMQEDIQIAVRLADNVNDITYAPLEIQRKELREKRRIGLGSMGIGSLFVMSGVRYGSDESVRWANEIQEFIANQAYMSSAILAKEKGSFPLFDYEKHKEGDVFQRLDASTQNAVKEFGLRNSHLTSIQPTGNTSILAGNVTGGIEPVFMTRYTRTAEQPSLPEGLPHVSENQEYWKEEYQGDERIFRAKQEEYSDWTIHPTRGICKDEDVVDYGVLNSEFDGDDEHVVTTPELEVDDHVRIMEAFAEYVDQGMSKTVNVPADYPYSEFKDLYESMHDTGVIKGGTTYRAGTMSAVLKENSGEDEEESEDAEQNCPSCGSDNVRHEEGCITCLDCDYSGCEL